MELWIGLAALKGDPKCKNFRRFGKGKGAWVNIAAWAESREDFEQKVRSSASNLDCILCELDDVGSLEDRMKTQDFPDEFIEMRATAYKQPGDTVFGTFHTWLHDDAN
jgi:hypothetical protein